MTDEYGVTPTGFRLKLREAIVTDMEAKARELFGVGVNLSAKSPLGILIGLFSWPLSIVWLALQGVYNSAYVDTATGQALDHVVKYIGTKRMDATKAVQNLTVIGTAGTLIPLGFVVETGGEPPLGFATIESKPMGTDGKMELQAECLTAGSMGNVPPETITRIKNPIAGINTVTNTSITIKGLDRETDRELRERYRRSVAKGGASTIDAMIAALLDVPGVLDALVIENDMEIPDAEGRPPHSLEAIVLGGEDQEIARAIYNSKAGGIQPHGSESYIINDIAGRPHTIRFNRADEAGIYVTVQVTANGFFPADGLTRIKDEIIGYIGGVDSKGIYNRGLMIGKAVIYMKIPDLVFNVPGVENMVLRIGTAPEPNGMTDIPVQYNQKAFTSAFPDKDGKEMVVVTRV
ncbi:MAG TPA: baseplate J/gp47 family protein [Bacillota bacterium]|nr:baseplate J/gp47 family protein [Bacillota bacterium]